MNVFFEGVNQRRIAESGSTPGSALWRDSVKPSVLMLLERAYIETLSKPAAESVVVNCRSQTRVSSINGRASRRGTKITSAIQGVATKQRAKIS